ncbi:hypothetical protein HDV01_000859 [Terramyces sp. JEL0728]|nr:hypothetical protein HDV01_000859 [Terramyces sp. JEL0728]
MLSNGPSGFSNTPTTKALTILTGITTLTTVLLGTTTTPKHFNIVKLFLFPITYQSTTHLFLGNLILYNIRILERHWGSVKFTSLLVYSTIITTTLQGILFYNGIKSSCGPFGFIFSCLIFYMNQIPASYHIQILGLTFSDRSFFKSAVAAACGLLTGMIVKYTSIRKWRISNSVVKVCKQYILPLLQVDPPSRSQNTLPTESTTEPVLAHSEEDIVMLESMGFSRPRIIEALRFSRNDIQRAIAYLLEN